MLMKVRFIGQSDPLYFIHGKVYNVLCRESDNLFRIVDESGEDYCYSIDNFVIVESNEFD